MSPPTTARQLETEAINQSIKLVAGVMLPSTEKFRIHDFCRRTKRSSTMIPRGSACQISPSFSSLSSFSERVYPCSLRRGARVAICFLAVSSSSHSHERICFLTWTSHLMPVFSSMISSISILQEGQWSQLI